jgi:hypothetical protein
VVPGAQLGPGETELREVEVGACDEWSSQQQQLNL